MSLLRGTAVATSALLVTSGLSSALGGAGVVLVSSSGFGLSLGLSLGLSSTFGKSLGGRDNLISLSGSNNDLNLDRSVVNEKTIQFLESLASAIRFVEGDVGDAAAL